jgi:hypothetical protein
MASGSGTSFEQSYATQNGGILPAPLPSSVGGNTYMYEQVDSNATNDTNAIIPLSSGGGKRAIRKRGTKGKKIPKPTKKTKKTPKTSRRKPKTPKRKPKTPKKSKCQICKLKLF